MNKISLKKNGFQMDSKFRVQERIVKIK